MEVANNKEGKPLEYYLARYAAADPEEMSARCGLPWDGSVFTVRLLGKHYTLSHPDLTITGERPVTNPERILFLRYLLDGRAAAASGRFLAYQEFPWGEVYLQQFTGRCIKRFAFSYGSCPEKLEQIMARLPAKRCPQSDAGWDVELMPGLTMRFLLWLGDEEFPPNGQILFSDNFRYAFTAEDLANAGDIVLTRMKRLGAAL